MKQPQYSPMSVADQALTLFAVNKGYFDDVEVKKALAFESGMRQHLHAKFKGLVDRIESSKDLTAEDEKNLAEALDDFKRNGAY
jgi:F-type H+-transporting ATPase subunit alpha